MNARSFRAATLCLLAIAGWEGSWSLDGTRILFTGKGGDVWVANADGSGQTNLTNWSTSDLSYLAGPAWSPDGTRILFASARDGDLEAYVMNADGSGPTNLTSSPGSRDLPGSPQGWR